MLTFAYSAFHTQEEVLLFIDCSISGFAGTEDSTETYELIQSWKEQTNSSFSLSSLPGNHFFIQTSRQILLEKLSVLVAHVINFGW